MPDQTERFNPYKRKTEHIQEPPTSFGEIFKLIGPGLILASSIVGSGELIATTVLGAENGYTLLWLIILSCFIKIVVQNELGRYAIGTGQTTLEAFDIVPGPRLGWYVWVLQNYADFQGRARRTEYWSFTAFNLAAYLSLLLVDVFAGLWQPIFGIGLLSGLYLLAVFVPGVAVSVRRLHDSGRSGWWILVALVPVFGGLAFLVLMVQPSTGAENAHGREPNDVDQPLSRFGNVGWMVVCWFFMVMFTLMQVGGMLGGIAEVLHNEFALNQSPETSRVLWVWVINFVTVGLLIGGRYAVVEKTAMALVVTFTALTMACAFVMLKLPEYFSWSAVLGGFSFQKPEGGIATAVAAFGITGVGATELVMYPYWCIEKGYARYAGPRDDSPEWTRRAYGWIKVMGVDVLNSMVIYTFATIAFYLLGAGVLNGMGLVPQGSEMVSTLSNLFTQTLGPWSLPIFLAGAVAVLYSTVFASTAAHTRVFADFVGMLGMYDRHDYAKRLKVTRIFVFILLFVPAMYFMFIKEPVMMVKIGGIAQAAMLPLIGFATLWLRYKRMPEKILPAGWITLALWVSAVIMGLMMGYSIIDRITG